MAKSQQNRFLGLLELLDKSICLHRAQTLGMGHPMPSPQHRLELMGLGEQQVRFLGHGVGLHIDEFPAIAKGFDEPLQANMTLALEPKRGIAGVGLVGIENTFVVTAEGGRSITGTSPGMLRV